MTESDIVRSAAIPLVALLLAAAAGADGPPRFDPYFLGYETEPAMLASGRLLASLQRGASRGFGALAEEHPGLAPVWEFPLATVLMLVQHEVGGHGGRARELGLGPSYGFGYDLSAYTTVERAPRTNLESAELAAGGVEADGVLGRRLLLDLYRADGAEGSTVPLLLLAKLDLTLYVAQIASPDEPGDFRQQFDDGYDPVIWLAARQAARVGADPGEFWDGRYEVDFSDPRLDRDYDDLRAAALWNALDPALAAAAWGYFADHVAGGAPRVRPSAIRLGGGVALTAGTRAFLAPTQVSRILDLHLRTGVGLFTLSARELRGSAERTHGYGASVHGLRWGPLELHVEGESWREPRAPEGATARDGWHIGADADWRATERLGLSLRAGRKSAGVLPGLPLDAGTYVGFGLLWAR